MRELEIASSFKNDYKRECKSWGANLQLWLTPVFESLLSDIPLEPKYRDHALTGNWIDFRDCHIKPNLILIYSKPDASTLRLVRLGSHAELSLQAATQQQNKPALEQKQQTKQTRRALATNLQARYPEEETKVV